MKRPPVVLSFVILSIFSSCLFTSCSTVALSDRKQLNMLPESQVVAMSLSNYSDFVSQNKLSDTRQQTQTVKKVATILLMPMKHI